MSDRLLDPILQFNADRLASRDEEGIVVMAMHELAAKLDRGMIVSIDFTERLAIPSTSVCIIRESTDIAPLVKNAIDAAVQRKIDEQK